MKKIIYIFISFLISVPAAAQDLQTVIGNSSRAMKLESRKNFASLFTSGHFILTGTEAKVPFNVTQARPDKLRIETYVFGFKAIQTYDGESAWSLNPVQGAEAMRTDARDMAFIAAATAIDGPFSLKRDPSYELQYQGTDQYQGKPVQVVSWVSAEERLKFYVDEKSWLVNGVRYEYRKNGAWYSMEYRIRNYRNFMGSLWPSEITAMMNGVEMLSLYVTDVQNPENVDNSRFGKPSYNM